MLFNSLTFIVFFVCVLLLHLLPLPWRLRKFNLLLASYVFYAAWNPPFVLLLVISTVTDWQIGKWLGRAESRFVRRLLVAGSLLVNLGLLGFFKYGRFFLDQFVLMAQGLGFEFAPAVPNIVLPVGISFYTFQTFSYTLDIYFRKTRPWHSFLDYALYVTFFPQLVAGPIVRSTEFLPQCTSPKRADVGQLGWGLNLLVIGLFAKIVVADGLMDPVVARVYNDATIPDVLSAWIGTLAFAAQIYCDFAGYSACAIGAALCLGFALPDNFRQPYAAVGFSDFWRRWHISLSTWLRDYLYIPLGGNRRHPLRVQVNLMLTMLIGGLWHGASWTFVFWGGLHGVYLVAERLLVRSPAARWQVWRSLPGKLSLAALTFALVCFTWVFFRASSFEQAFRIASIMLARVPGTSSKTLFDSAEICLAIAPVGAMLAIQWFLRDRSLEQAVERCPGWLWSLLTAVMLSAIIMMPGEDRAFIYFQF